MRKFKVLINGIDKVKNFCDLAIKQDYELSLQCGRYIVDAKSILGIFSLDLTKAIDLVVEAEEIDLEMVKKIFKDYIPTGDM